MADNTETASGTGVKVATDKVTYSGDADQNVQLVRIVQVTGTEGSKTVVDLPGDDTSGLTVKLGHTAIAHGTNPTAVAAAARTNWYANRAGVPFVMGGHPNIVTATLNITTGVTDTAFNSMSIGAGMKCVVTGFQFTVDNASTVFPKILLGFGATNTPTTTGVIGAHGGVPAGGGFGRGDGSGIIGVGADGEELRVTTVGTIGGNGGYLTVSYYTVES
jgi:hypothetical protein